MTLLATRTQFIKLSGRFDLVVDTTDYEDNGADWFINSAQKMLAQMANIPYNWARLYDQMAIDSYYKAFANSCRAIKEVWMNTTDERWRLTKRSFTDLKNYYGDLLSEIDSGQPLYYTEARLRNIDDTDKDNLGAFLDYVLDDSHEYNGILWAPPNDEAIVLEVYGLFYETALSDDADESFWTERYEDLLVTAALYKLEVYNRNREGQADYMTEILRNVQEIEKDTIEQEIVEVDTLEG